MALDPHDHGYRRYVAKYQNEKRAQNKAFGGDGIKGSDTNGESQKFL